MTTAPVSAAEPTSRRVWLVRWVIALVCLGGPLVIALGLGWIWYQSVGNLEVVTVGHAGGFLDEKLKLASTDAWQVKAETLEGVLGITWSRDSWSDTAVRPLAVAQIRKSQGQYGWYWGRVPAPRVMTLDSLTHPQGRNVEELPPILNFFFGGARSAVEAATYQPFGRDRSDIGWTRTLHWKHASETRAPIVGFGFGGTNEFKVEALVAPCWVWMLPLVIPPLWWFWCQPGQAFPRLTIGRTLLATALAALILAALTTVGRSSAADRALLVLEELGGKWTYRRDPGGSDRQVVTAVQVFALRLPADGADAAAARVHAALRSLPHLQSIDLSRTSASSAQVATMIGSLPNLVALHLNNAPLVDDATLDALRGSSRLTELYLSGTKVTDAGLSTIRTIPSLEILWLEKLNLTGPGLTSLMGMPSLRRLNFAGNKTPLADADLRRLARSLPAFEILWNAGSFSVRPRDLTEPEPLTP